MSTSTWIWQLQFYDNGTLVTGSKYKYINNSEYFTLGGNAGQLHVGANGQTAARINYGGNGGTSNFELTLYDPSSSRTIYNAGVLFYNAGDSTSSFGVVAENNSLSMYDTSAFTNISGIRILAFQSATFSGTFKLYGIS